MIDVDSDKNAFCVEVQDHTGRNFAAFHARAVGKVDIQGVCLGVVLDLQSFDLRSGNSPTPRFQPCSHVTPSRPPGH